MMLYKSVYYYYYYYYYYKTNLDFTEARDSAWQWHQLGHMQVCTSPQTDKHASTPPLSFLHAGCPSCRPTSSVKALKARQVSAVKQQMDPRDGLHHSHRAAQKSQRSV